jgi:alpha-beta hydrolase superfamily lysophospholipase
MTRHELEFLTADGIALFGRSWLPEGEPRALVCIVHGLGEHGDRYEHVAADLVAAGFAVIAPDHRGHGRSGGLRGHVDGFTTFVEDLTGFIEAQQAGLGEGLPLFLLGHSMGGLIALLTLQGAPQPEFAGAIISNPCLGVAVVAPRVKIAAAKILSKLLPKLRLDNELNVADICRDPAVVAAYEADPLVHSKISSRWYTSLLAAMDSANSQVDKVSQPTLWLLSGQDAICDTDRARDFASALPAGRTTLNNFPEAFHEAHNGPDKDSLKSGLVAWLDGQLSA